MNTATLPAITHNGTLISYNEQEDKWKFTLRGRDRSADSLAKAKECIDRPVPEDKKKFTPVPAWKFPYEAKPVLVTITGIAESSYGREEVWIRNDSKERSKIGTHKLRVSDAENDAVAAQVIAIHNQITALKKERFDLEAKMKRITIASEE